MLKVHASGYYGIIRADGGQLCTRRLRQAIVAELYSQGLSLKQVGEVFGLHASSVQRIVKQDERAEPLFGSGEWTPAVQDQDPRSCDRCGGDDGVIKRGSKLYCAACHRTGFDRRLAEQRVKDDIAEQLEELATEYQAASERKPLAKRRKIKRA